MKHIVTGVFLFLSALNAFGQSILEQKGIKWNAPEEEVKSVWTEGRVMPSDPGTLAFSNCDYHDLESNLTFSFCADVGVYLAEFSVESPLMIERATNYQDMPREQRPAFDKKEADLMIEKFQEIYTQLTSENVRAMRFSSSFMQEGKWLKHKEDTFEALVANFQSDKRSRKIEAHWMSPDKLTYMMAVLIINKRKSPLMSVSYYAVDETSGKSYKCP